MRFVLALVLGASLAACGKTTVEHASVPAEETTTTVPYDGRLHVAVVPESYAVDSEAMASWRMDPAPAELRAALSVDEVRAAFEHSDFGRGTDARYYFGLFTGNQPNPNAPDGTLTGVHPVADVPAWLVVIDDLEMFPSGGGYAPGHTPPTPQQPVQGWAWTQLRDASGAPTLTGFEETGGGEPPPIY